MLRCDAVLQMDDGGGSADMARAEELEWLFAQSSAMQWASSYVLASASRGASVPCCELATGVRCSQRALLPEARSSANVQRKPRVL
jgi:hypothetical protein